MTFNPYKLEYAYDALEPYISKVTLYTHYNKHYLKYLDNLNKILSKYNFNMTKEEIIKNIDKFELEDRDDILYNLGGVINHEQYFKYLNKKGSFPKGKLKEDIIKKYGSFTDFKKEIIKSANNIAGSGYTFLSLDPKTNNLMIINTSNQDNPFFYNLIPLFNIDVWEHAYYLDYLNNRNTYLENIFNIIDFEKISEDYEKNPKN